MEGKPSMTHWTYKTSKLLHVGSAIAFLGGILACIVLDAAGHLGQASEFVFRRRIASDLSHALIIPAMFGIVLSGALLSWRGGWGLLPRSWVGAKQILGLAILANGTLLIMPRMESISGLIREVPPALAVAAPLQRSEDALGAANFGMAVLSIVLAIWRPSRQEQSS
jgi:hypothetical protein